MATKKYYGVKKGKITGVFKTWDECKASVDGFPGAEYKGFTVMEEACAYVGVEMNTLSFQEEVSAPQQTSALKKGNLKKCDSELPLEGTLLAYVDGSYHDGLKKYAFGCVFILPDGSIYTEYGNGDNPQSLQQRNVAGEMLGAMYAVRTAMVNGYSHIEIRYDYEGIEKWVTGEWRSKTELTQKYARAMRGWMQRIEITFTKVPAHSNVKFNELADQTAKAGLVEADGIPEFKKLEEMRAYGTDSIE